jgi:hypothetical protein
MEPMKPMKPMEPMKPMAPMKADDGWWPEGLSNPSSSGGQNGMKYAFFPDQKRLAIERDGKVEQFDTGSHRISGVSQSQSGDGGGDPVFSADGADVALSDLRKVG